MAAFRKLFLVLAVVTMFATLASAQSTPALQCVANAGVPPTVRTEGLTELVGDVTLNCTGGVPTQIGALVPASNVTIFLNTNITSRILSTSSGTWSEALLMVDEPHSVSNPTVPLLACGDANTNELTATNPGQCQIFGTGNGLGVYNGTAGRPNVFQGRVQPGATNAITWSGIPFDAPGTLSTRVVRITNVRANANLLPASSTLVPTQITMYISVTGSNQLPINNPTQTVAFIQVGLTTSIFQPGVYQQCVSNNYNVATGNSYSGAVADFVVRMREGFQSSFKRKNWATDMTPTGPNILGTTYPAGGDNNQNIPGAVYNTESAFENIGSAADPTPTNPPAQLVVGSSSVPGTASFPAVRGLNNAGVANAGTRLMISFTSVVNGTSVWVPTVVRLTSQLTGAVTGTAVLTSTDSNGAGGFSPVSTVSGSAQVAGCSANVFNSLGSCPAPTNTLGLAQVSTFNGAGIAVYEVLYSDAFTSEQLSVPVVVAYVANPGGNLPAPGVQTQVNTSFAPLSTVVTASSSDPIPRFALSRTPTNLYIVQKCSCNLLFPFVTNQLGYDTGVAIANTSLDAGTGFGTTPQAGVVILNYYCGQPGCTSPPQATTNAPVAAGQQLLFTLSGGGQYGIPATPGFQGYIIAQAQFQFCHAYAFITAQGSLATSAGANTGYIALEIDNAMVPRTGNFSEVAGH